MKRVGITKRRLTAVLLVVALGVTSNLTVPAESAVAQTYPANADVSTSVDEAFLFSVAGKNSGSCNGSTITGTGSTSSAVSLGRVNRTSTAVGGQELHVASNAVSGFSVFARVDGPLRDSNGNVIAAIGSSNANPAAFPSPGTEAFGYTTDSLLGGAAPDRFIAQGNRWAGIDTNDREVMRGDSATAGSTNCVAYQITISQNTPGGFYGNNVTYTAVPSF